MKTLLNKLLLISQEIEPMEKDGENSAQHYKYLSEAKVKLNVRQLLNKHKVVFQCSSQIKDFTQIGVTKSGTPTWNTQVRVDYVFYDVETGEKLEGCYEAHGTDTQDKGAFKATTGAVKNILMQNFLIPTGDDPEKEDKQNKNVQSPAQSKQAQKESPHAWSKEQVEDILKGKFNIATGVSKAGKTWYALDDAQGQRGWIKEATYNYIRDNFETNSQKLVKEAKKIFLESPEAKANRNAYMTM